MKMNKQVVVFSGFESKELEDLIEAQGGKVKKTLAKTTTILVYDPAANTKFVTKAELIALLKTEPVVRPQSPRAMSPPQEQPNLRMSKEVVVFSGFESKELESLIEAQGGVIKKSLVKGTTLLAYDAKKAGKKVDEARNKGIKVISKDELVALLTGVPARPRSPPAPAPAPAPVPAPAPAPAPVPMRSPSPPQKQPNMRMSKEVVVFSGFRSDELQSLIEAQGGKVEKTLVKFTTILVYDAKKAGSKVTEALKRGIKVYNKEEMTALLNGKVIAAPVAPPAVVQRVKKVVAKKEEEDKSKVPARLPKVWTFEVEDDSDDSDEEARKYFKKIKGHLQTGDIIMPEDGYRGEGTYIVGPNKTIESPIELLNGQIILPPWVIQLGMNNGYSFEQVRSVYEDTSFILIVYPMSLQGKSLKKDKDGRVTSLRAFYTTGQEEVIYEGDGMYYDDLSDDLYVSTLFTMP